MSTTLTPPPLPPVPPTALAQVAGTPGGPDGPRASSRVIAILAIALGTTLILGTIAVGVGSAVRAAARGTATLTADATGIRDLDIDIAAANLEIVYRGDAVTLDVTGNAGDWHLGRDGESLTVSTDRSWWGPWRLFDEGDVAVLTLPASLENTEIDADLSLSAGQLRTDGTFGELDVDLSAGTIDLGGSARSLDVDVSAGRLQFDLADVGETDLQLSAGSVTGTLTGSAPREVTVDVSAGRLELTLPDETYAVTSDVSAGDFQNRLRVDAGSAHRVSVEVSAGFVGLHS